MGNGDHESPTADYDSSQIGDSHSLFPIPHSPLPLPIPHSLFPISHSPLPSLTIQPRVPHSTPSPDKHKDDHCMSDHTFSLFHQTAPPKSGLEVKPPLLLLLHGYGANEDDLFSLAPYLDERFMIVSARGPIPLKPMSYAWLSVGFTPQGIIVNPEEVESSRRRIHKFIGEIVNAYECDPDAVYLMGFSQGAMMSLAVALTYPGSAAGVVAMSGRMLQQTPAMIADKDA